MIKPGEVQNKAREVGVRGQQIEKDYVLSWMRKPDKVVLIFT